jgi:hypothetical protein
MFNRLASLTMIRTVSQWQGALFVRLKCLVAVLAWLYCLCGGNFVLSPRAVGMAEPRKPPH